jgi:outer membrane protein OmpA-like peptidoglycan-associated protein
MSRNERLLMALPLLAGCVSSPPPAVELVRSEYQQAAREPRIAQHASLQLHDAEQALRRLESTPRRDEEEIEHLVYVTKQRIAIARAAGEAGALEEQIERLGEHRDELRLNAREAEAAQARAEAASSEADAEMARRVAASAIDRARDLESRLEELKAEQTERGLVMTMSDVLFAFGKAELLPGAERALGEVATLLNEYPDRRIAIEGHTDNVGSDEFNERLSRDRAEAVASLLRARGVDPARIEVRGLGEKMPVASNDEDAGRQANRRVEIVLAEPPTPAVGSAPPTE